MSLLISIREFVAGVVTAGSHPLHGTAVYMCWHMLPWGCTPVKLRLPHMLRCTTVQACLKAVTECQWIAGLTGFPASAKSGWVRTVKRCWCPVCGWCGRKSRRALRTFAKLQIDVMFMSVLCRFIVYSRLHVQAAACCPDFTRTHAAAVVVGDRSHHQPGHISLCYEQHAIMLTGLRR